MYAISSNLKEFLRTKKVFSTHPTNFQLQLISKNICHSVRFFHGTVTPYLSQKYVLKFPFWFFFTAPSVSPLRDKIIFLLRFSRPISTPFPNHCKHKYIISSSFSLTLTLLYPSLPLTHNIIIFINNIFRPHSISN